ncbi:hypothetical protein K4K61_003209 [Colletotrichum sp. SAR11_59]|nr:hypothetical protein K4K61_003209 [Colletotrichum sp. SAR11_59]
MVGNSRRDYRYGIYDALYELSHNHDALALNLDYDIEIDNNFHNVFVPGIIAADPNARLFRMSSSIEEKIEKRYWDDPLLSTLLEPAEASSTDVFRSLPPEIVFYIISFMDLRSIFRSLKASPAIYELISNNFNFWKRQLTNHFPWYNDLKWYDDDLREYIVYGYPDLKGSDLMRVAFQLQEMPKLDNLDMISMANERRIHQVCKHIADKIQVRREFRQQRQQKYMKDEDEAEDIEFEDDIFLWLNNLIPEITREVESNIFNNDIVPNELIAWIDAVGNVTLKRLSGWLAPTGSPLPAPENCGIPGRRDPRKYNLCGLRAELSSGEVETIGAIEINGVCWPEEELVHFDVDVENGEEINEIGVASDAGDMPAVYMRTNRDREMLFARGSDLPDQWNSFAGMSHIGALSGFLDDGGSDEDEAGEQGSERGSDDEDNEDDGRVGYLEEANEE